MIDSLLARKIEKRPNQVRLQGRILFLTEDPELIKRQLAGEDLPWDSANPANNPKLRDDISTDEITPAHYCFYFDETLGEIPYLGLKCGNATPIGRGDVKRGGFVCAVSGKRRGKGSSREQSPYAEMCAGIRVVIAENIERIYKQNCQNLGLLTSTNFSLIDRIRGGEEIALSEFTAGEDEITRQVIEYGGLFPFNVARMQGKVFLPPIENAGGSARATRAMTLAEKIFARHMIQPTGHSTDHVGTGAFDRPAERSEAALEVGVPSVKPGDTGFARADLRFSHEYVTPMAAIFFERYVGKDAKVNDPSSILFFRDHLTFLDEVISEEKKKLGLLDLATQLKFKQQDFAAKQGIRLHGELTDRKGSEGICHSIVLESYALPGQLNIGSDSHTPHVGAIGCVAFGIGTTDVFNSWITKDVRVKVPESVRIVIRGKKHANVTAKDFILKILSLDYVRSGKALAKVMEYAGEAIEELSVDERATMTNMAAEIGGFTGIVAPDKKAVDFLVERRSMDRAKGRVDDRGPVQRSWRAIRACDRTRCRRDYAHGGHARRSGKRKICSRVEHARSGRDRLRRHLHRGQERRHGYVRRRARRCAQTGQASSQLGEVLHSVRIAGNARILPAQGISGNFSEVRSAGDRAQLRSLHQRWTGSFHASRPGRDQRAEPQFPRPQRPGADVPGLACHSGRQRGRRLHRGIRTQREEGTCGSVGMGAHERCQSPKCQMPKWKDIQSKTPKRDR